MPLFGKEGYLNAIAGVFIHDGLKEGFGTLGDLGKKSGGKLLETLKTSFSAKVIAATAAFMAMKAAWDYFNDKFNLTFDAAMTNAEEAYSAFSEAETEIDELNNKVDSIRDSLKEVADEYDVKINVDDSISDIIDDLQNSDKLSLESEVALANYEAQNAELERQLAIKKQIAEYELNAAAADARAAYYHTMNNKVYDAGSQAGMGPDSKSVGYIPAETEQTDFMTQYKENVDKIKSTEETLKSLREEQAKCNRETTAGNEAWNNLESRIKSHEASLSSLSTELSEQTGTLEQWRTYWSVDGEGLVAAEGYEELFDSVTEALDYNLTANMDDAEKALYNINKFFDGSTGRNALKDKLQDAYDNGDSLNDVLKSVGQTVDSIGAGSIENLEKYFRRVQDATEDAEKSVMSYSSTISDIKGAQESEDQDSEWKTASENYIETLEDLKEGKTGTDDVMHMARYLNPEAVKKYQEEYDDYLKYVESNGKEGKLGSIKYQADVYQKAIEDAKKYANRWFATKDSDGNIDETANMENFVNDFKKKGLFDVKTDDMGLWDITTKFETTAEAAKEFGMGIESVESMLRGLEAYGYDFSNIIFSADGLSEYQENLNGLKEVYDSMKSGSEKDALYEKIWGKDGFESNYNEFEQDLTKLTEDKIIQIEFQYNLAQIESEIAALKHKYETGGNMTRDDYSDWITLNDAQYEEQSKSFGFEDIDENNYRAIKINNDSVINARNELSELISKGASDEEIIEAQVKLVASQESRDALMDAFNSWNLEQEVPINADSSLEKIEDAWNSFFTEEHHLKIDGVIENTDNIESTLNELGNGSTITFTAKLDDGNMQEIIAETDMDGNITYYSVMDDGTKQEIDLEINKEGQITINAVDNTSQEADNAKDNIESIPEERESIFKFDNTLALIKIRSTKEALDNLDGKTVTAHAYYITHHQKDTDGDGIVDYFGGTVHKKGTAHSKGTAHLIGAAHALGIHKNIPNDALTNEKYRTDKPHNALVGELGPEILVSGDSWRLIGEHGAEFRHIPAHSIIFNHEQTKKLLSNGKINSRGKVQAGGTAHLGGTAYRLGDTPDKGSGSSDSSKDKSSKDKSSKDTSEKYDWIERLLQKIQRAIEKLSKTADATYKTWKKRNNALYSQISKVRKEITQTELAKKRYEKEAANVGLSKKYRNLVKNGKIDITTVKSEKTREKIDEYTQWYEKIKECEASLQDLADTEAQLYVQAFDNVSAKYDAILERVDWRQSMLDEYISQAEAKGQVVSAKYYQGQIKGEQNRIGYLTKERDALYKKLEQARKNGIEVESEEWNNMVNEINAVTLEIEQAETAILEFENSIRDLEWEAFDRLQEKISQVTDEAEFLIELMSNDDMYDDDGKLTEEGLATMGLHGQNYNVYMEQANKYAEEIKKLEAEIAEDPNNQDLIERKQELIELQRESILAAESEKQAIVDMVEEGINKELEALQELIDKKKEELQSQKELYEYQKKMKNLTKEQASVQKQLVASQGDDSEENKARLQQLKVQLEESQEAIDEAEYEKYMSDQEELLDSMYEEYEEILNARLDNVDALIEETIHSINTSSGDIQKTLEEQASEVGYTISDEMNSIWSDTDGEKSVLTTFEQGVATGLTTVNSTLETMNTNLVSMIEQLNKVAGTDVKGLATENAYNSDKAQGSSFKEYANGKKPVSTSGINSGTNGNKSNSSGSSNNSGKSGDNKITKGEKVTFKSGKYTEKSNGGGASGKQMLGEKVYVTNIKSGASRPYHISKKKDGSGPLGWVKKEQLKGYYTGAKYIDEDQWAKTQEKGLEAIMHNGELLTPVAKGSTIFNADATANLYDFMNDPYQFIKDNVNLQQLSSISKLHEFGNYEYSGNMSLEFILPNVTNYEQLKYAIKHDPEIEQSIRAMTVDRMFGKSALRKYK